MPPTANLTRAWPPFDRLGPRASRLVLALTALAATAWIGWIVLDGAPAPPTATPPSPNTDGHPTRIETATGWTLVTHRPSSGPNRPVGPADQRSGARPPGQLWREVVPPAGGGRPVVLNIPPSRIVSQALVTDEILLRLVPAARVVAHSTVAGDASMSNVVEEAAAIAGTAGTSAETVLVYRPDLVLMAAWSSPEMVHQLEAVGAPVLRLGSLTTWAEIRDAVRVIGFITGADAAAARWLAEMDQRLLDLQARIPAHLRPGLGGALAAAGGRPRVLFWNSGSVHGEGTIFADLARLAGAVNIPSDEAGLRGWPTVGLEQVVAWMPDLIVTTGQNARAAVASLLRLPLIARTPAGERATRGEGGIVALHPRTTSTASPDVLDMLAGIVDALYPASPASDGGRAEAEE